MKKISEHKVIESQLNILSVYTITFTPEKEEVTSSDHSRERPHPACRPGE